MVNYQKMNKIENKKINPLVNQIFPDDDLKHKYKVKKIIGKGQFGYVAKAVRKSNNQFVAIKKITNIFQNAQETKRILRQIVFLKNCNHPSIVSLIEVVIPHHQTLENFNQIYIVTEYCDTDLKKLFQMNEMYLQIDDVKYILYQIACGIKYLHSASIIHRDLTPSNVLINGQGMKIKICDLGLARVLQKKQIQNNDDSSDEQNIEMQLKQLFIHQKEAKTKQIFDPFHNIDCQSLPSSPKTQNQNFDCIFSPSEKYFADYKKNLQNFSSKQDKKKLTQSENLNQLRVNDKKLAEADKKPRKKLHRLNSKICENINPFSPSKFEMSTNEESIAEKKENELSSTLNSSQKIKELKKRITSNPIAKLTLRVTTRWYRAPEVILLEKGYHKPIDIWSLGCLFGELLKMVKTVCANPIKRFPLFPGKYCYPVSPATLLNINREANELQKSQNQKNDQLFMILSTIGKPSEEDLEFLSDQGAKDYIRGMQDLQRKQFKKFFASVPEEAIQILQKTLVFNPNKRLSIGQIIEHKFLQKHQCKDFEKQRLPIKMEFEEEENLTVDILKHYLANQIKCFIS